MPPSPLIILLALTAVPAQSQEISHRPDIQKAGLEACLKQALENNHHRPASTFALDMAQAQHRQALAGYWPQITAQAGYSRLDEAVNFRYPATTITLPPEMGGMSLTMPEQEIDILEEKSYTAAIETTWLLYDGGMRKGLHRADTGTCRHNEKGRHRSPGTGYHTQPWGSTESLQRI